MNVINTYDVINSYDALEILENEVRMIIVNTHTPLDGWVSNKFCQDPTNDPTVSNNKSPLEKSFFFYFKFSQFVRQTSKKNLWFLAKKKKKITALPWFAISNHSCSFSFFLDLFWLVRYFVTIVKKKKKMFLFCLLLRLHVFFCFPPNAYIISKCWDFSTPFFFGWIVFFFSFFAGKYNTVNKFPFGVCRRKLEKMPRSRWVFVLKFLIWNITQRLSGHPCHDSDYWPWGPRKNIP